MQGNKISVILDAQIAGLQAKMGQATATVERFGLASNKALARLEASLASADATLKNFATGFAAAFATGAVAGLGVFFKSVVDGVDRLNDMADATGASVENLSALEDIALRTGTATETVTSAMVRFNGELSKANKGTVEFEIFKRLGLDAEELKRIDPAEALLKTAQALAQFADDGEKARYVQALFGKSVAEIAPLLKDLADAGQLNATVTTEQAKAAEAYNKNVAAFRKNMLDLARLLSSDVLMALNSVADAFRTTGQYSDQLSGTAKVLAIPLQALAVLGSNVAYVFRETGREIGAAAAQAVAFGKLDFARIAAIRAERLADAAAARKAIDDLDARLLNLNQLPQATYSNEGRSRVTPLARLGALPQAPRAGGAGKEKDVFFGPEVPPGLAEAFKLIEQSDDKKAERLRDALAEMVRIVQTGGSVPDSAFARIAEDLAKLTPEGRAAAQAMEELKKQADEARRIFDETRTPSEVLATQLDKLQRLLEAGAITWDTYGRAVFDAQDKFDSAMANLNQQVEKSRSIADELGLSFSSAFEDAIVSGKGLRDVLQGLEADILRIVARKLITEPLGNAVTGMLGNAGSAGNIGATVGGWIKSLFSGFFAEGGYIPPGRWGVTGERGPEVTFGGRTGATVIPQTGATMHFHFAGPVDRRTQQQVAAAAARGMQMANMRGN